MTGWTRHARILGICWRAAVASEVEYRLNVVANVALSMFWMLWAVAGASVYVRYTGVKPFDAQLLVSLRHLNVNTLLDPVLGLALTTTGIVLTGQGTSVTALASFAWMLACAVLLMYALTVAMMALAVKLVAAEELSRVSYAFVELSRFPVDLYRNPVQTILTVVPVAFLTTYPAAARTKLYRLGRCFPSSRAIGLGLLLDGQSRG